MKGHGWEGPSRGAHHAGLHWGGHRLGGGCAADLLHDSLREGEAGQAMGSNRKTPMGEHRQQRACSGACVKDGSDTPMKNSVWVSDRNCCIGV